jgi:outer membrane protein OmpA-like peptidoglycan-associated protein
LPESFPLLDEIAEVMKTTPGLMKIEVQGHTDDKGNDRYNKKLSQRRADAVKKHLIKLGVNRKILAAVGYGEERPIADNGSEEGREKNRRVEFKILERAPAPK